MRALSHGTMQLLGRLSLDHNLASDSFSCLCPTWWCWGLGGNYVEPGMELGVPHVPQPYNNLSGPGRWYLTLEHPVVLWASSWLCGGLLLWCSGDSGVAPDSALG